MGRAEDEVRLRDEHDTSHAHHGGQALHPAELFLVQQERQDGHHGGRREANDAGIGHSQVLQRQVEENLAAAPPDAR